MKVTAPNLKALDIIDEIVSEPLGGAHRNHAEAATNLERYFVSALRQLRRLSVNDLLTARYDRWRRMGKVAHASEAVPAGKQ